MRAAPSVSTARLPSAKDNRRRAKSPLAWPLFGLTLLPLIAGSGVALAGTVPTGATVKAGQASIVSGAGGITVNQTTDKAIIDWASFSVGSGQTAQFNNGSGATLNRVTGSGVSSINGQLSATGSIYLLNPNGVIIGKDGVVKVGGSFVASTLGISDTDFLKGGSLSFSGNSSAAVINLGTIGALGGDVVLAASTVRNDGQVSAPKGDVGLLAGVGITLRDMAQNDGKFIINLGSSTDSATNSGTIQSAMAELRANGGNVYALAGNLGGVISATGVSANDGRVILLAQGGETVANGVINATKADGTGGEVETSGATVNFNGLRVHAANWLVDPTDLTVDAAAAATINANLATTSVTLQTTASGSSGPGNANSSGVGDINITAPISWSTANTLTLDAYHGINILAPITVSGAGKVVLTTNDGGSGGDYGFGLTSSGFTGSLSYTGTSNSGQALTINGQAYTLLYSMSDLTQMNGSGGNFALASHIDASGTTYSGPIIGSFSGQFTGLGNTIANLAITSTGDAALFDSISGGVKQIGVTNANIHANTALLGSGIGGNPSGNTVGDAGIIAAYSNGSISFSYTTGAVSTPSNTVADTVNAAGGLVGANSGRITNSFSTSSVFGESAVGGLVGANTGNISNAFATGAVTGTSQDIGGLVGVSNNLISNVYATGDVTGPMNVGGLIGWINGGGTVTSAFASGRVVATGAFTTSYRTRNAGGAFGNSGGWPGLCCLAVSNVYFDATTSGANASAGGTGLATSQLQGTLPAGFDAAIWSTGPGLYPFLKSFGPPVGAVTYSITGTALQANGTAAVGASIGVYLNGQLLNGSAVTSNASGQFTEVLAAAPSALSNLKIGETLTLSGSSSVSGANYADQLSFGALVSGVSQLQLGPVTAGKFTISTADPTYSALQASLASTYGTAFTGIASSLHGAVHTITATSSSGFNVDQALALVGDQSFKTTAGDLTISAPITWATGNALTLDSYHNLRILAPITASGAGQVTLTTNDGGSGGDYDFGLTAAGFLGSLSFTGTPGNGQALSINGAPYTLLYSMGDVAGISGNPGKNYALAGPLNAAGTTYSDSVVQGSFSGAFAGLGHTVANLAISAPNSTYVGLFAQVTGAVKDVGLLGGTVAGGTNLGFSAVGSLVGMSSGGRLLNDFTTTTVQGGYTVQSGNGGTGGVVGFSTSGALVSHSFATGAITGTGDTGGLVGRSYFSTVTDSFATGAVSGTDHVGGLIGHNDFSTIINAYATGAVSGTSVGGGFADADAGGLVGTNYFGTISNAYATGRVTAPQTAGGLMGYTGDSGGVGTWNNAYWDTLTTGQSTSGAIGTSGASTTSQLQGALPSGFDSNVWGTGAGLYPYLKSFYPTTPQAISGFANNANGTAAGGASVSIISGGSPLTQGSVSTGANGYFYALVPGGTVTSTTKLGETLTLSGASTISGLSYTDQPVLASGNVSAQSVTAGVASYTTANTTLSGLNADVTATFGNGLGAINAALAAVPASTRISANGGFVVDTALTSAGSILLQTGGDLTIAAAGSVTSSASGDAVTLAANGSFINNAGAGAVITNNGRWLIYTQASGINGSAAPSNSFGGLAGKSYYGDQFNFATAAFASQANAGNRFVYGYQPTLTITPDTQTSTYNGSVQTDTYSVTGLTNGDTAASALTGTVTGLATNSKNVGAYGLTAGGALTSDLNYAIAYGSGTLTINPAALTLTAVTNTKTYDGGTSAAATPTVAGLFGGDTVTGLVETYADKNAGTGKTLSVSGYTVNDGNNGQNYSISTVIAAGEIDPKSLAASLTGTVEKTYDGGVSASLSAANYAALPGTISGDDVSLSAPSTGLYADKNAGTGKLVTASGLSLIGVDASNYVLTSALVSGAVGQIDPKALTISLIGSAQKTYDGSASIGLTSANFTLPYGILQGDQVALVEPTAGILDSKHAGTGKTVTAAGTSLAGADAGNYILSGPVSGAIGQVAKATLTLAAVGNTKVYDGSVTAADAPVVTGLVAGDTISGLAETYSDKTAGTGKTLNIASGFTVNDGNSGGDYNVTTLSSNAGVITKATLSASLTGAVTKVYDGTTAAILGVSNYGNLAGLVQGDSVVLNDPTSGVYSNKNAGTGKVVTVNGLSISGSDAANYQLAATTLSASVGTISQKVLTQALTGTVSKVYDGTAAATLTSANYAALSGVVSGDTVTVSKPTTGSYADKNAATGKTITVTGLVLSGTSASNYALASTSATGNIGTITKKALTSTLTGSVSKVYDGTTAAALGSANFTLTGVVAGDTVNATGTGTFNTKNVGTGKTVTVSTEVLDNSNYTVAKAAASAIGTITQASLTLTANASTKTYDGALTAATLPTITGLKTGDTVTSLAEVYADKNVGTGKTLNIKTGYVVNDGNAGGNYVVTLVSSSAGVINPKILNAALTGTVSKTYDGTATATLSSGNYVFLSGVISGDTVSLVKPTAGLYSDANAGTGKTVTVTGVSLQGASSDNYVLASTTLSAAIGTIVKKALTASLTGTVTKAYDGTTAATLGSSNYLLSGVIAADAGLVALNNQTTGTYDTAAKGTGKTVTVTGLGLLGTAAANYTLPTTTITGRVGVIQ